jgi:hypothetical protein
MVLQGTYNSELIEEKDDHEVDLIKKNFNKSE